MASILICASPSPGHVNPLLIIAGHLAQRGHDITFATASRFRRAVEHASLRFEPLIGAANYNYDEINLTYPELGKANTGIDRLNGFVQYLMAEQIIDQRHTVDKCLSNGQIDAILVDHAFLGVFPLLLGGQQRRPPVISCGVTAPLLQLPEVSPFSGPDSSADGLQRNARDNKQFRDLLSPGYSHVDRVLSELDYAIPGGFSFDTLYSLPDRLLQCSAREFEFSSQSYPKQLEFVGPIIDARGPKDEFLIDGAFEYSERPLIFATQGTLANFDFSQLIQPTIDGLASEEVNVLVSAGGGNVDSIAARPNARVVDFVPYRNVLARTSVFVTNGGYNGVQEALCHGVPIVVAGETEDKPMVAARVQWSGCGIDLRTGTPDPEQVADAVREVLHNEKYAERARMLQTDFAKYRALATIESVLNQVIPQGGTRRLTHALRGR
jgi:MGT family glycosyltransferase